MKSLLLMILCLFTSLTLHAQEPTREFLKQQVKEQKSPILKPREKSEVLIPGRYLAAKAFILDLDQLGTDKLLQVQEWPDQTGKIKPFSFFGRHFKLVSDVTEVDVQRGTATRTVILVAEVEYSHIQDRHVICYKVRHQVPSTGWSAGTFYSLSLSGIKGKHEITYHVPFHATKEIPAKGE